MKWWLWQALAMGLLILAACDGATSAPEAAVNGTPAPETEATVVRPPTPPVTASPVVRASPMVSEGESSTAAGDSGAATATPTPAMAQAADQRDVAEHTPEVTLTEAPVRAATPTPSPLPPTALPPSATPRPTNTASPTATPTESSGAAVDYFRANVEEADPGDTITLEWAAMGAETVTLWRLMATGQLGEFWDVSETGSFVYQIPEHARNWTTFALAVTEADGSTDMVTLEIGLRCPDRWYFDNPPDICPARAAVVSAGAEQRFQGGVLLWSAGEDRIYVLYGDGQSPQWAAFTD